MATGNKAGAEIEKTKELAKLVVDNQGNVFLRELVRNLGDAQRYPARRTARELRQIIDLAIDDGKITWQSLTDWLTTVQGWGREWVYLWSIPKKSANAPGWDAASIATRLPDQAMRDVFAETTSPADAHDAEAVSRLRFTDEFRIERVAFVDKTLTFEWHQAWPRLIREPGYDYEDQDIDELDTIAFQAYRKTERRAVVRLQIKPAAGLVAAFMQVPAGQPEHKSMLAVCEATARAVAPSVPKAYDISKLILAWDAKQLAPGNDDIWTGSSRLKNASGYLEVGAIGSTAGYRAVESLQIARAALLGATFNGHKATMHFKIPSPTERDRIVSAVFDADKKRFKLRSQMSETQVWDFIAKVTRLPKRQP